MILFHTDDSGKQVSATLTFVETTETPWFFFNNNHNLKLQCSSTYLE